MLAKRYEDDGKEFLKLNSVQKATKDQFLNKFFGGIGNVTEEAIKKYITEQSEESRKEDSEGAVF